MDPKEDMWEADPSFLFNTWMDKIKRLTSKKNRYKVPVKSTSEVSNQSGSDILRTTEQTPQTSEDMEIRSRDLGDITTLLNSSRDISSEKRSVSEKYIQLVENAKQKMKDYLILTVIGKGKFGTTYLVQAENLKQYILKEISYNVSHDDVSNILQDSSVNKLLQIAQMSRDSANKLISANIEINVLKSIRAQGCRPDILCFVDSWVDYDKQAICIVTEKFPVEGSPAKTLDTYLNNTLENTTISQSHCLTIIKNILKAFAYLHAINVTHNDIKPANILIDGEDICVIDFGTACQERYCFPAGTRNYLQPDYRTLDKLSFGGRMKNTNLDIYSLGVIILELVDKIEPNDTNTNTNTNTTKRLRDIGGEMKAVKLDDIKKLDVFLKDVRVLNKSSSAKRKWGNTPKWISDRTKNRSQISLSNIISDTREL
jgi:serine/threonine protein kinase